MNDDMVYGLLVHLGRNMWNDADAAGHLRCDMKVWTDITEHLAECQGNMLVIDIGEALVYPSHPELAVSDSWTADRMKGEVERLKAMGIEAIPKLNFSAAHDAWLKDYSRELSTPEYYRVVSEVIRDVADIFGRPRYFHLGWDEENAPTQKNYPYCAVRQGPLFWKDLVFTADEVKKHGCRPWIWSDKEWLEKDDFMTNCPRDILQSHWYYSPFFGDEALLVRDDKKMLEAWKSNNLGNFNLHVVKELEDAGFDQIPCGSNIYHDNNFPDFVRHCVRTVSPRHLKGFLSAPWFEIKKGKWDLERGKYLVACEQLAGARGIVRHLRGRP